MPSSSSKAIWDGSKPIRGGIPIVFRKTKPFTALFSLFFCNLAQFGTGRLMAGQHGFARRQVWDIQKVSESEAICTLSFNEATLQEWPYKFKLIYRVSVEKKKLITKLEVCNPPEGNTFAFHALLHNYFAVKDINNVRIQSLKALQYADKLQNGNMVTEEAKDIKIDREVDRMYLRTPPVVTLSEGQRRILIRKSANLAETVLWNPWIEKSKTMLDFDDEEVIRFAIIIIYLLIIYLYSTKQ